MKFLEQMTEENMLGFVRIMQQFLSDHHTIISIGITLCLFTRNSSCVTNIIPIIMVCYYILPQRIIYIGFDFVYLHFSVLHDFNISLCRNILKMQT